MRKSTLLALSSMLLASVTIASPVMAQTESFVETNHGWVCYHTAPRLSSRILGRLQLGQKAPLVKKANAWWYDVKIGGKDVYITTNTSFTHVVQETANSSNPSPAPTPTPAPQPTPTPTPPQPAPSPEPDWQVQADKVISVAKTQIGVPYLWGHQVPGVGFDCSNFSSWAYRTALGISFSSSSVTQRNSVGTPVALSDIHEGDLLFFSTASSPTGTGHVGIYAGDGMIIQEGGGRGKVTYEPMAGTWFARQLVFARRVIQ